MKKLILIFIDIVINIFYCNPSKMGLEESTIKEHLQSTPECSKKNTLEFQQLCENAKTAAEIKQAIAKAESILGENYLMNGMFFKDIYNLYIGWAMPTEKALTIIFNAWKTHLEKYPDARLVDFGAGTGVYCFLLQSMGVPQERLIALELETKTHKTCRNFFPLTIHNNDFEIKENDFLLVCWGYSGQIGDYIEKIHCVVIQGEKSDGCTFPTDYLVDDTEKIKEGWKMKTFTGIPSLALPYYGEQITVNTRYD